MVKDESKKGNIDWLRFGFLAGFLILFVIGALVNGEATYGVISGGFGIVANYFGGFVQLMMVTFWLIALFIAISKFGNIRIGGKDAKVETNTFSWYGIIITTMLAGGGVFYAAAEPFYHFVNVPPHFAGVEAGTFTAAGYAVAQGAFNWGYLVWGATAFCIPLLAYVIYEKGLPNRPSSMLYLIGGEKVSNGIVGKAFDIFALIGVAAGTIGPTGFLGLQIAFALNAVWGIPNTVMTQVVVILIAAVAFVFGAATGLKKGMDYLSKATIYLGAIFAVSILLLGTGMFVVDNYVNGLGIFIQNFFTMSFSRSSIAWMGGWTVFYQIWFLAYGPSMAVLTLSMSKGRSLRQILLGIAVVCPLITGIWFAIFGGSAIGYEMLNPGVLTESLNSAGLPSVLISLLQHIPGSFFMIPLALVLIVLFLVTTGAGAAYSMAVQTTHMEEPYPWIRALFAGLLGVVAAALVIIGGNDAMSAMQNFIVICGLPLVFFYVALIPSVLKAAKLLYQNKSLRIDDESVELDNEVKLGA
jgi:choline-glycine betaine transporter